MTDVWKSCYTCRDYAIGRRESIAEPLAQKARAEGRDVIEVVDEYMLAAHEKHVTTGEPLRPSGPTRITDERIGRLLTTYAMLGKAFDERNSRDVAVSEGSERDVAR